MNTQTAELEKHIAGVMTKITEAAAKHDLPAIQKLSRRAAELDEIRGHLSALQTRIAGLVSEEIEQTSSPQVGKMMSGKLRELPVEVTEGDIRQNLLKLTPHVKRRMISVGEELLVEALPSGEKFQTVVSAQGNKLRARGEIKRFYESAKVKAGDYVLLIETTPKTWTLKKAPHGEYGIARTFRDFS